VSRRPRATGTPQTFPVASRACSNTLPGSSRRNSTQRDAPRPARIRQVRAGVEVKDVKRRFLTYSLPPRSPDPPHLAVLTRPGFVGAAPALPGTTRLRLPPATPPCCDRTEAKVSHLYSNDSALRRRIDSRHVWSACCGPGSRHLAVLLARRDPAGNPVAGPHAGRALRQGCPRRVPGLELSQAAFPEQVFPDA